MVLKNNNTKKTKEMKVANELCLLLNLAKDELLELPVDTKLTTSLMACRLSRFKALVLVAVSCAEKSLGNEYVWKDKLSGLKLSVADLQDLLTMYTTSNRHSMFRTVSPDRKPALTAKELIYAM